VVDLQQLVYNDGRATRRSRVVMYVYMGESEWRCRSKWNSTSTREEYQHGVSCGLEHTFGACNVVYLSTHLVNVVLSALDCHCLEEWVQYQTNPNVDHPDTEGLTRQHISSTLLPPLH
jgi:hypothetical protein